MKEQAQRILRAAYALDYTDDEYHAALLEATSFIGDRLSLLHNIRYEADRGYFLGDWRQEGGTTDYRLPMQKVLDTLYKSDPMTGELTMRSPSRFFSPRDYWAQAGSAENLAFYDAHFPPSVLGFLCTTGEGDMFSLLGGRAQQTSATKAEERYWGKLTGHLSAAWRLRRRLQKLAKVEPSASFTTKGEVLHAEGSAKEPSLLQRLREAVLRRELAMSQREPGWEFWPELVEGRWTLIDRFTDSGRRYVIALSNAHRNTELYRLEPLEQAALTRASMGDSGRLISQALQVSEAHASRLVRGALSKLGIASLLELSQLTKRPESAMSFSIGAEQLLMVGFSERSLDALGTLTEAERAVMSDLLRGLTYQEIALRRGVSARTVTNQAQSIFGKYKVSSRRELLASLSLKR